MDQSFSLTRIRPNYTYLPCVAFSLKGVLQRPNTICHAFTTHISCRHPSLYHHLDNNSADWRVFIRTENNAPLQTALYSGFSYMNNCCFDGEVICKPRCWSISDASNQRWLQTWTHKDRIFMKSAFVLCKCIKISRLTQTFKYLLKIIVVN